MNRRWTAPSLAFGAALAVVFAACLLVVGSGLAVANEPPMAEAGLDQTVDVETAVYLDAGGSDDTDGTVESTEWTVVAPNGTLVNTSCANCTRTRFTPDVPGEYEATVTVTDDRGARSNDTLYVTARAVDRPSIEFVGPNRTTTGTTSFVLDASPGDAALLEAEFHVNGTRDDTVSLSDEENATVSYDFTETGTVTLRAVVRDVNGYTNRTRTNVTVVSGGSSGSVCGLISTYGPNDAETTQRCGEFFNDDLTVYLDDEQVFTDLDTDGEVSADSDDENYYDEYSGSSEEYSGSSSGTSSSSSSSSNRQGYDYSNWSGN